MNVTRVSAVDIADVPRPGETLSDQQADEIRARYVAGWVTQREIAEEYGITQGYVSQLTRGLSRKRQREAGS